MPKTLNYSEIATRVWAEFLDRYPVPELNLLSDGSFRVTLHGYKFHLKPVSETEFKVLSLSGAFEEHPEIREDYDLHPGIPVNLADLQRFVLDHTEEFSWDDQVASRLDVRAKRLHEDGHQKLAHQMCLLRDALSISGAWKKLFTYLKELFFADDRQLADEFEEAVIKEFGGWANLDNPLQNPEKVRAIWKRFSEEKGLSEEEKEEVLKLLSFWSPIAKSRVAASKFLLRDKRSRNKPNKSKLKVKSFRPHFDTGPTYYGIVDETCGSWLKGHEYETEKEAKRALSRCKKGKEPMEFRGF